MAKTVTVTLKVRNIETTTTCEDCGGTANLTSTAVHGWTVETVDCPECGYHEVRSEEGVRLPEYYAGPQVEFESPAFFIDGGNEISTNLHGRRMG